MEQNTTSAQKHRGSKHQAHGDKPITRSTSNHQAHGNYCNKKTIKHRNDGKKSTSSSSSSSSSSSHKARSDTCEKSISSNHERGDNNRNCSTIAKKPGSKNRKCSVTPPRIPPNLKTPKRSREPVWDKGGEVIPHAKKICVSVYDVFETLNRHNQLEDMPSTRVCYLAVGRYWVMCADGDIDEATTVYLLQECTRCVKRVWMNEHLWELLHEYSMECVFHLNVTLFGIVVAKNHAGLIDVTRPSDLKFSNLHEFGVRSFEPFTFSRLVRKGENEEFPGFDLVQCNQKLAMFRSDVGYDTSPSLSELPLNTVIYIVGPVINKATKSPYRETLLVVVEGPRGDKEAAAAVVKRGESPTYKVHLLGLTQKLYCLLNRIPPKEKHSWQHSYYNFLCGDYVIKMQLAETEEKTVTSVVPLSDTPFYGKPLKNHIFV